MKKLRYVLSKFNSKLQRRFPILRHGAVILYRFTNLEMYQYNKRTLFAEDAALYRY
nr:MAG TPA: hypothetical protein [Caudoviricetes sp.]